MLTVFYAGVWFRTIVGMPRVRLRIGIRPYDYRPGVELLRVLGVNIYG
jgi:hypothetical protein